MSRLPIVGGDDDTWGDILNDFLSVSLNSDGTLKTAALPTSSTTVSGIVELATSAETITGTDTARAVTPVANRAAMTVGVSPVSLTDGATINTDASLSNYFRVTINGNRTLAAPTNATDGQRAIWEVTATGGNRTLTLTTGSSGAFSFGTDFTIIPTITSGTTTFLGAIYRSSSARWHVISLGQGH